MFHQRTKQQALLTDAQHQRYHWHMPTATDQLSAAGDNQTKMQASSRMQAGQQNIVSKHADNLSLRVGDSVTAAAAGHAGPVCACELQCSCKAAASAAVKSHQDINGVYRSQIVGTLLYQGQSQQLVSLAGTHPMTVLLLLLLMMMMMMATLIIIYTLCKLGAAQAVAAWLYAGQLPSLQVQLLPDALSHLHSQYSQLSGPFGEPPHCFGSSASAGVTRQSCDYGISSGRTTGKSSWHRRLQQGRSSQQQQPHFSKALVVLQQPASSSAQQQQQVQQAQQFSKFFAVPARSPPLLQQQEPLADSLATASAWLGAAVVRHIQATLVVAAVTAAPTGTVIPASTQSSPKASYAGQPYLPTQAFHTTAGQVPQVPVAAWTVPVATQAGSSSYYPQTVVTDAVSVPAQVDADASGITVSTSTPVYVYNPINVSTPLQQTTVQQAGSSGLLGGGSQSVMDALLVVAALKPRMTVVPVFIGK